MWIESELAEKMACDVEETALALYDACTAFSVDAEAAIQRALDLAEGSGLDLPGALVRVRLEVADEWIAQNPLPPHSSAIRWQR
jgi:hypothetical protein